MKRLTKLINSAIIIIFMNLISQVYGQEIITGKVYAEEDEVSLPGVNVVIKGSNQGTVTDLNGNFTIEASSNDTLVFSYIGYITKEVPIGNRTALIIVLSQDASDLEEVVVVGYGTQRKSDVTGTVASLPQERLEMVPNMDISQALQGAIPGVFINTSSAGATPGYDDILIRGRNSIQASNEPLIVVDGVPYGGQLRDININDIKSIEVLKDASAAAIYGSRGANGVILITTKGGIEAEPVISYDGYYSVQKIANFPDLMDGEQFYQFKMERDSLAMTASEQEIYESEEWVDWADLALRDGMAHQHNLSVAGGSKNTKYYIGGNLLDVQGLAINDEYLRISSRVNIETRISDWLTIGTRSALTTDDRSGISPSFGDIFWINPLTKPYNEDGSINLYPWPEDRTLDNPLESTLVDNINKTYQVVTNNFLIIDFPFLKGLQYKLSTGNRFKFTESSTYYGRNTSRGLERQGSADLSRYKYYNTTIENIISFKRDFGRHRLFLTGLYSYEKGGGEGSLLSADGFPNDVLTWYSAGQANLIEPSFYYSQRELISQMGRVNYAFDNRYLFTFTFRRDGYSGFGSQDKWGNFPSLALGWNIANEQFFSRKDFVNALKLRVSWGKNGNQAIGPYQTISRLRSRDYVSNSFTLPGYVPSQLGADNLGWETTESLNIGLDFGILSNRITGDINLYTSNTYDLLLERTISPLHGIDEITQNIGETNNRGFEFSVNSNNISKQSFNWTTLFNISFVKNKIVSLYGELDENGDEIDDIASGWFIGQPIESNFGYVYDGVWQTDESETATLYGTQPGFIKIRDLDGDTLITDQDRTIIGQRDPKFMWGMTNTISYKNFTLNLFIHGIHGVTKSNSLWSDNVWTEVRRNTTYKRWWTPENNSTEWYANHEDANTQGGAGASVYENASFIRLKDITFAYDLPNNFIERLRISKFRIYFTGRNLFTWTEWTGLDPELGGQRAIPLQKEYVFGINLSF